MTDAAEAWLAEHDPDYETTRAAWPQLQDGSYVKPRQEFAWGSSDDLEALNEAAGVRFVAPLEQRACESCNSLFVPREVKQKYCSERCRWRQQKRRQRMSASPS